MSAPVPSPAFHAAAVHLSSSPALAKVANATKLELYGLFKRLTAAPAPPAPRPGLLDFAGRAKWDAWAAAGTAYGAGAEPAAEARYLEIARALGWDESAVHDAPPIASASTSAPAQGAAPADDDDDDGDDDGDGDIWDPPDYTARAAGGGLSVAVSAMAAPAPSAEEDGQRPLHALALGGDAGALRAYLDAHPDAGVDELDDYGYTPLHLACDRGHVDVARLLLERGADRTIPDADDLTALELAQVAGRTEVEALFQ